MTTSFDDAVVVLFQASPKSFVAERKRLSAELRTAGDTQGALRLAKLSRPPLSAWVVNQLWWHERNEFDELLSAAERVRQGDLGATAAHRDALAKLRTLAATMLDEAGHAATEATLRRVTTTLSALAAAGGFDPDPPGGLSADRDAPGFEHASESNAPAPSNEVEPAERARQRAEAKQQQIADEQRARKQAERQRLEAKLRDAKGDLDARTREVERLRIALTEAEARVERARTALAELEARRG